MPTLEDTLRTALQGHPDVVFAYLFGSRSHGQDHPRADVDVAVYVRPGTTKGWAALEFTNLLAQALRRDDVDVLILNDAPPAVGFEALKGTLLFSRDEAIRVEKEARIMSRYHDRLPYLRRSLSAAMDRVREHGLA